MSIKVIKVIGFIATVTGMVTTVVTNWAGEKQQEAKIAEKVAEAFAKVGKGS